MNCAGFSTTFPCGSMPAGGVGVRVRSHPPLAPHGVGAPPAPTAWDSQVVLGGGRGALGHPQVWRGHRGQKGSLGMGGALGCPWTQWGPWEVQGCHPGHGWHLGEPWSGPGCGRHLGGGSHGVPRVRVAPTGARARGGMLSVSLSISGTLRASLGTLRCPRVPVAPWRVPGGLRVSLSLGDALGVSLDLTP